MSAYPGIRHVAEGIYLLDPAHGETGPARLQLRARTYERLMDYIYTPIPLEKLSRPQIHVVNMLREDLIRDKHIGGTDDRIKNKFADAIVHRGARRVLEWGCGFDSLKTRLGDISYEATDIDPWVIRYQWRQKTICRLPEDVERNIGGKVDAIPSIFVFQFGISDGDIRVMSNVLSEDGFVLANVYRRSPESRNRLRRRLAAHGLTVHRRRDLENLCKGNEYWVASKGMSETDSQEMLDMLSREPVGRRR